MPFKSKKQKKTIDAAAHNPAFAKKVNIDVADAKKMSKDGKGQTKFKEERTEVKDKDGKVTSWKDETPWRKAASKDGRGKVTNLSDKARRETEKLSKAEKEMAESFEKAISEVKVTSGPNKGKEWSPKTPGPTNPDFKDDGSMGPSDGSTAPPPGYKPPKSKSMKKAEVTPSDAETELAETKAKQTYGGKGPKKTKLEHDSQVKQDKEKKKFKKMAEAFVQIGRLEQMIFEAKKSKCTCSTNEDTCKVHSDMKEGLKGGQKKLDVNKNGKLEKDDFTKLRAGKTEKKVDEAEKTMSRAAKGHEKYGKEGMAALAKAGKEGKDLDTVRKKYDKYDEAIDKKCNHTPKGKKCPVHGLKECGSGMYEGSKVDQNKDGKNDFEDVKIARMKAAMKGKSKKVKENFTHSSLAEPIFENDEYMQSLHKTLQKRLKG
jgi:hypothetical protein